VLGMALNRELVIEWRNIPHNGDPIPTKTAKLQVVFFKANSKVLFNYADTSFGQHPEWIDQTNPAPQQRVHYTPAGYDALARFELNVLRHLG